MSKIVFVLYVEKETSQTCGIVGAWDNRESAIREMKELVDNDEQYSEYSIIDLENGFAQSDPTYSEEKYSDYKVMQISVNQSATV